MHGVDGVGDGTCGGVVVWLCGVVGVWWCGCVGVWVLMRLDVVVFL